ncbi:hypothetical protein KPH14_008318 [Odynerus spinipes]|uniref:Uncharacterized protein n=1 Tax=Odynerus spinipes TaxID=1348599 RepID=A0AAD9VIZ6_9HYME|nr:hypothetical protein KPH14_008318 [Odynerus spinipes]
MSTSSSRYANRHSSVWQERFKATRQCVAIAAAAAAAAAAAITASVPGEVRWSETAGANLRVHDLGVLSGVLAG